MCILTVRGCKGRIIDDFDDQSSQFFSRARIEMDKEEAMKKYPFYGSSVAAFRKILKKREMKKLNDKLKKIK